MKKLLTMVLVLILMMSFAAVHAEGDVSGELTIYLWDNEYAAQAVVEAYQEAHPDVKITLNLTPFMDYQTKLFTSLAGGADMDVFFMREEQVFQTYVAKGLCMNMNDLIASTGFDMTPYENYLPQISVDDGIYQMPYRGGGYHLYYNKTLFDEAGIPYPDMYKSYTWAEFAEVAKQLTKGEGADKVYGVYMMGWPWMQMFSAMQRDVKIVTDDLKVDLDCQEVRDALQWYYDTCVVDGSQLTPAEATAINASITPLFVSGQTAMILGGDYMGGNLKNNTQSGAINFEWGMARVPCDEDVEYSTHSIATCACINSKAKNPELAFDFISFLSSTEGQKLIAAAGSKPAMANDEVKQVWADNIEVYDADMVDLYFEPVKVFSDPLNEAGPFASTILTEELSLYMTEGGQDLDTTIANSVARIEEEIANLG